MKVALLVLALALSGCGKDGAMGPKGDKGDQGEQGLIGLPGEDASPVTIVKFCPGVTTYPSRFVEIGFCIGGKVYGTYSANGGFSTELPPGSYGSAGINSSCNFVILPNCGVSN